MDYYSSFIEVERLAATNTTAVIEAIKRNLPDMEYQTLIVDRNTTQMNFMTLPKHGNFNTTCVVLDIIKVTGKRKMLLK